MKAHSGTKKHKKLQASKKIPKMEFSLCHSMTLFTTSSISMSATIIHFFTTKVESAKSPK
jgi:hypothetical protein